MAVEKSHARLGLFLVVAPLSLPLRRPRCSFNAGEAVRCSTW